MNKKCVVISQPMYLPWRGLFEQMKLCDVFVHYDDVKYPQGGTFINRVQIKTATGIKWLTVPIDRKNSGYKINETLISYSENWQDKHLSIIDSAYSKAPYKDDISSLMGKIHATKFQSISQLNIYSIELIADYFNIKKDFKLSSKLGVDGSSSERLVSIVKHLNGEVYVTGLGAMNYIDYNLFEKNNISLEYMNYSNKIYMQLHGDFTPYVTILDIIANLGKSGIDYIESKSVYWKEFIDERSR